MTLPRIAGYMGDEDRNCLATLWSAPKGIYPDQLWPEEVLAQVTHSPIEWITIAENYFNEQHHGGRASLLSAPKNVDRILESQRGWVGRGLGAVEIPERPEKLDCHWSGLTIVENGCELEFFAHLRTQHGLRFPTVEVSLPFLWYWDALEVNEGWDYLDEAGGRHELIRYWHHDTHSRVQVRALELRRFLADTGRVLVVQVDHVPKTTFAGIGKLHSEYVSNWAAFTWHTGAYSISGYGNAFARLVGQYVIRGAVGEIVPHWLAEADDANYIEFQYGVDPETGMPLLYTCDHRVLGTYFDDENSAPHYLTPVYFSANVLDRYTSEPDLYEVSDTHIRCLDMWSVSIGLNSEDLVEVYLGDIGRDIPSSERMHWKAHNVVPKGRMAEDRFRRDFLGQWASAESALESLKKARDDINELSRNVIGGRLWKLMSERDEQELRHLRRPTGASYTSLKLPVIALTKAFYESIDLRVLKAYLGTTVADLSTNALLDDLIAMLGGDVADIGPIKDLQRLRSKTGIAHIASTRAGDVLEEWGIGDLDSPAAFDRIVQRLSDCLEKLQALLLSTEQVC